jgi:hypothetical protein
MMLTVRGMVAKESLVPTASRNGRTSEGEKNEKTKESGEGHQEATSAVAT